jgi:branched-chain amino acid transport system ATP-binding protein
VHHVLKASDRAYVLENGRIVLEGQGTTLLNDERLKVAYLGL